MYYLSHYQYEGSADTPDRRYDLLCITPDSDNNPSFLIRRWGKKDTKGSAKIEMFDRATRASINLAHEQRQRDEKGYVKVGQKDFECEEGFVTFDKVQELLPMLGKDHKIYEVLEDIKRTRHKVKGDMTDVMARVKAEKRGEKVEKVKEVQYTQWGTW